MSYLNQYSDYCFKLQNIAKYRQLPDISCIYEKDFIDFSSNDYLNLSHNKELLQEAINKAEFFGVGSTGSRLLSGNSKLFEDFEKQIALDKSTEAAIIWNSGFQANFSALSALLDKSVLGHQPIVFCDKLNHASLYQAILSSKAELVRYQHNDMNNLANLLNKYKNDQRNKFIVSETVYGMDGDIAPLEKIIELAVQHQAFLYLDEAHATGIFGKTGYGLSVDLNFQNLSYLIMGTFSKAIGVCGAYTATSTEIKNYLINKAWGFIYSTALSPMVIGAAFKSWNLLKTLEEERHDLLEKASNLRKNIQKIGFDTGSSTTHIIPILLKNEEKVLRAKEFLLSDKIIVSAIRPPTVPPNSSRLRIALTLKHNDWHIERLLTALQKL